MTPSLLLCTSTEIVFGKYVKGAWVDSAFARDPANGLLNYGWTSVVQLGGFCNQAGATFSPSVLLDFTCGALATLSAIQAQLAALLSTASSIRTMSSFMIFGFLHITKFLSLESTITCLLEYSCILFYALDYKFKCSSGTDDANTECWVIPWHVVGGRFPMCMRGPGGPHRLVPVLLILVVELGSSVVIAGCLVVRRRCQVLILVSVIVVRSSCWW